jgi:PAS domain S-box-containing protein
MNDTNVLIVEDEIIVAKDLENKLKKAGYTVVAVLSSGEEAIDTARETELDLILMDIRLRGKIDGVDAARQIHEYCSVPIIFLTANADKATFDRAKMTQPVGYLLKPFKEKELYNTIEITLSRYEIEKKLKENQQWLATILKSIGDGIIACDRNNIVTFMNSVAETLTGWQQADAVGKTITEVFQIVREQTKAPTADEIELDCLCGTQPTVLLDRNGREIPIDCCSTPIKDEKNNIQGAVVLFRDITERKQIEAFLYRRQQEFRALVENAPDIIARFNRQFQCIYVNPAIENLMGMAASESSYWLRGPRALAASPTRTALSNSVHSNC